MTAPTPEERSMLARYTSAYTMIYRDECGRYLRKMEVYFLDMALYPDELMRMDSS